MDKPAPPQPCPNCNGKLVVLVDVNLHPDPHQQDRPRVVYFRCQSCGHIQIVTR